MARERAREREREREKYVMQDIVNAGYYLTRVAPPVSLLYGCTVFHKASHIIFMYFGILLYTLVTWIRRANDGLLEPNNTWPYPFMETSTQEVSCMSCLRCCTCMRVFKKDAAGLLVCISLLTQQPPCRLLLL